MSTTQFVLGLLAVGGGVVIFYVVWDQIARMRLSREGIRTVATVVDYETREMESFKMRPVESTKVFTFYCPVIEFVDTNGQKQRVTLRDGSDLKPYAKGEQVNAIYLAGNPAEAQIEASRDVWASVVLPLARKIDWRSVAELVAANVATIAIALLQHWPLTTLLWPFWLQSVIIGWYTRRRILSLSQFSIGERVVVSPGAAAEGIKRQMAEGFFLFYAFFHAIYFGFFLSEADAPEPLDLAFIAAMAVAFAVLHRRVYARIMENDRTSCPGIVTTAVLIPFVRVAPVFAAILLGFKLFGASGAVVLFGMLKMLADVLMHWVEQWMTAPRPAQSLA